MRQFASARVHLKYCGQHDETFLRLCQRLCSGAFIINAVLYVQGREMKAAYMELGLSDLHSAGR
jgi:hypothetical protein